MSERTAEYVTKTLEGSWRLSGTRVSLDSIVHAYWDGRSPETIAADFPSLSLEQIHGAIAFYLRHRDEIDQYLVNQDAHWRQLQQQSNAKHGSLLERIRKHSTNLCRPEVTFESAAIPGRRGITVRNRACRSTP